MHTHQYRYIAVLLVLSCFTDLYAQNTSNNANPGQSSSSANTDSKNAFARSATIPSATKTGGTACPTTNGLAATEIEAILAVHNKARAEIGSPLLTWSCGLAGWAQDWANKGIAQHREYSDYGENIFVAGDPEAAATDAVNKWLNERPQWNNTTGSCAPGKTCTHYTQIVWKRTRQIGCGINRNAAGKWKVMLVCNYDPAGNNQPGSAF